MARYPSDQGVRQALEDRSWTDAERLVQTTLVRELDALQASAPSDSDWTVPLDELHTTQSQTDAHLERLRWKLDHALSRGDIEGAWQAHEAAKALSREPRRDEWTQLMLWRLWQTWPLVTPALLATLIGAAAGYSLQLVVAGRRDENGFLAPKRNPYRAGGALERPDQVFGREAFIAEIFRHLNAPTVEGIYLTGLRRCGKSSTLLTLRRALLDRQELPVLLILDPLGDNNFVAALRDAMSQTARRVGLDCREIADPLIIAETLARRARVVLLIDNIQALDNDAEGNISLLFQLTLQPGSPMRLVAAGRGWDLSHPVGQGGRLGSDEMPLATVVRRLKVPPLDADGARELLTRPAHRQLKWTDEALKAVISESHGQPFRMQLYATVIYQRAYAYGRTTVTPGHVAEVRNQITETWNRLQAVSTAEKSLRQAVNRMDILQKAVGHLREEHSKLRVALEEGNLEESRKLSLVANTMIARYLRGQPVDEEDDEVEVSEEVDEDIELSIHRPFSLPAALAMAAADEQEEVERMAEEEEAQQAMDLGSFAEFIGLHVYDGEDDSFEGDLGDLPYWDPTEEIPKQDGQG